jgi:polysaccharide export outer membrane protein
MHCLRAVICGALLTSIAIAAQNSPDDLSRNNLRPVYVLGSGDQVLVRVLDVEEFNDKPVRIEMDGSIRLPLVGRIQASGSTAEQLASRVSDGLKGYVRHPQVTISIAEFGSQPVSVIGSVKSPGIHQLQGRKTLVEVLSLAGGVTDDAGYSVKITRRAEFGAIPLPNATTDPDTGFHVAEVNLKGILEATHPEQNIAIQPNDVISVPRAKMIYVTGQVRRSGGFVLNGRDSMTVLQAISLAGGVDTASAPEHTRILRAGLSSADRAEMPIDLKKIMEGKATDVALQPEDILFIPSSVPKKAAIRAIEAAIQVGTGIAIFR